MTIKNVFYIDCTNIYVFYIYSIAQPNGRDYSQLIGGDEKESPEPFSEANSCTTPLERRDIPPQLSETLEHIVAQLDVITQVIHTLNS